MIRCQLGAVTFVQCRYACDVMLILSSTIHFYTKNIHFFHVNYHFVYFTTYFFFHFTFVINSKVMWNGLHKISANFRLTFSENFLKWKHLYLWLEEKSRLVFEICYQKHVMFFSVEKNGKTIWDKRILLRHLVHYQYNSAWVNVFWGSEKISWLSTTRSISIKRRRNRNKLCVKDPFTNNRNDEITRT